MLIKYESELAKKYNCLLFIFPYILCPDKKLSDKEKYISSIYYDQYNDFIMLGLFLAIIMLFAFAAISFINAWLFLLCLIPIFLYNIWFFIEYAIKQDINKICFVAQANDLGQDWELECNDRRNYSSLSWLEYL